MVREHANSRPFSQCMRVFCNMRRSPEGRIAPIMMTAFDCTPVSPIIGMFALATMKGYAASTLLEKKYLYTGPNDC